MLDSIKFSVISILDLYRTRARQWYGFSLWFLIVFAILTAVFSAVIIYLGAQLLNIDNELATGGLSEQFLNILGKVAQPCAYTLLLCLGLFAAYMHDIPDDDETKPSLGDLFTRISSGTWTNFLILAFVINVIYVLTYHGVFKYNIPHDRSLSYLLGSGNPTRLIKLYQWLNAIIEFIVSYLPYIGALIVLLSDIYERPLQEMAARARTVLFPVLILSFCLGGITNHASYFIREYINKAFAIPFLDAVAPTVLQIVTSIIISAFFFIAAAGVFLYPVMYDENLQESAAAMDDFQAEAMEPDISSEEEYSGNYENEEDDDLE